MPLEPFKTLSEITVPDPRSTSWVLVDRVTGESRPLSLEDVHERLSHVVLSESVPEDIQTHFLTAKHLALYSWFVYRFTMPAQLQAFASLEYALRERFKELALPAPPRLSGQLEFAAARGFLKNERFRDWPGHNGATDEAHRDWLASWIRRMPGVVSYFRNDLAHGSFTLYPQHDFILCFAADAINQLYSK